VLILILVPVSNQSVPHPLTAGFIGGKVDRFGDVDQHDVMSVSSAVLVASSRGYAQRSFSMLIHDCRERREELFSPLFAAQTEGGTTALSSGDEDVVGASSLGHGQHVGAKGGAGMTNQKGPISAI